MIKTTLNPTTFLMEKIFTTLKNHNQEHYHNITYYQGFIYHLI
jgi:hypothetical protein